MTRECSSVLVPRRRCRGCTCGKSGNPCAGVRCGCHGLYGVVATHALVALMRESSEPTYLSVPDLPEFTAHEKGSDAEALTNRWAGSRLRRRANVFTLSAKFFPVPTSVSCSKDSDFGGFHVDVKLLGEPPNDVLIIATPGWWPSTGKL